ncbi:MAG: hypothetical protein ACOY9Y_04330 [Bacillota bacterium]
MPEAVANRVACVPGVSFFSRGGGGKNTMRLNLSNSTPDRIAERISRLGNLFKRYI